MTVHDWVFVAAALAAAAVAALRWLRVAQREHYLTGSVLRFARRWAAVTPVEIAIVASAIGAAVLALFLPSAGWWVFLVTAEWPLGLGLRGRSSQLAWTPRLRRLAAVAAVVWMGAVAAGIALGQHAPVAVWATLGVPLLIDAALAVLAPIERRLGRRFVARAASALRRTAPQIVAITGSYGKTSTKGYVRHLLGASHRVIASPASFNNRMGLARAVNEHLAAGTQVFVAEMGTYGPGEIADLCRWIPPDISVITAIGPVHLERMGSLEEIAAAKAEILADAAVAVVNADVSLLVPYLETATAGRIVRCSAVDPSADVAVIDHDGTLEVRVAGETIATVARGDAFPMNVACAVGAALAVGADPEAFAPLLASLPVAEHRAAAAVGASGITVIDDTYNANPAGAAAAVDRVVAAAADGASAVVTPGMVELGPAQAEENEAFAVYAAARVDHFVIVGRTNRPALLEGAGGGRATVTTVPDREAAVAWVRDHLTAGDAVLYENDLPDHYP
jgi:UDP-N-acetylmuramoyl-tripeptide--D-alanyl-D-alanine ligase